jgi:hypothetical protein
VRFEGKTRWNLEAEAAARAQVAREARERDEARRRGEEQERREIEAAEEARRRDADVARLVSRAYVVAGVACFVLVTTGVWGLASGPWSELDELHTPVGIGLAAASVVSLIVALAFAGMPIKRRTGFSGDAMVFIVWFYAIFGFVMPVVGQIMCLVTAFKRFGGLVGGNLGEINGSAVSCPVVQLKGESVPLGLVYLALALLWPAAIVSLALTG